MFDGFEDARLVLERRENEGLELAGSFPYGLVRAIGVVMTAEFGAVDCGCIALLVVVEALKTLRPRFSLKNRD